MYAMYYAMYFVQTLVKRMLNCEESLQSFLPFQNNTASVRCSSLPNIMDNINTFYMTALYICTYAPEALMFLVVLLKRDR